MVVLKEPCRDPLSHPLFWWAGRRIYALRAAVELYRMQMQLCTRCRAQGATSAEFASEMYLLDASEQAELLTRTRDMPRWKQHLVVDFIHDLRQQAGYEKIRLAEFLDRKSDIDGSRFIDWFRVAAFRNDETVYDDISAAWVFQDWKTPAKWPAGTFYSR